MGSPLAGPHQSKIGASVIFSLHMVGKALIHITNFLTF